MVFKATTGKMAMEPGLIGLLLTGNRGWMTNRQPTGAGDQEQSLTGVIESWKGNQTTSFSKERLKHYKKH